MAIDIINDDIDFSCSTIDDLILADIRLNAIVGELKNYQYEDAYGENKMGWVTDKHEAIKTELKRRLKNWNKKQVKELRGNKLAISLEEIKDRIDFFKNQD